MGECKTFFCRKLSKIFSSKIKIYKHE